MGLSGERTRFLFRSEEGVVDAATWRLHVGWLIALAFVLTIAWLALRPFTHHDLKTTAFFAPMTIIAFVYVALYTFAVLLIAVSYTMLSMKRLRDRRQPTGLAGLVPLLALFAGSLHFLQAQTPDVISIWYVVLLDASLVAALAWTIVSLGFGQSR